MSSKKSNIGYASVLTLVLLCGCASVPKNNATNGNLQTSSEAKGNTSSNTVSGAAKEIATQPFKDLGFMKKEIPPALAQITDPYATPEGLDCAWISYQVTQLDSVLPKEAVLASTIDDRTDRQKSGDAVSNVTNSAVNEAVRGAATSIVPVRGIVRKLSGAEKADSEYNAAVERGKIRRGYLRGLSFAKNCPQN